jgi:hypothetical protein
LSTHDADDSYAWGSAKDFATLVLLARPGTPSLPETSVPLSEKSTRVPSSVESVYATAVRTLRARAVLDDGC